MVAAESGPVGVISGSIVQFMAAAFMTCSARSPSISLCRACISEERQELLTDAALRITIQLGV
ncbi:hypothetical protein DAT35_55125 [Vitiosangium sp. GDMCC 1.1324]|nr:hypothetical protein DAT35_55125 [Vitiosangium sp. GDMCC 1.1324]